MPSISFDLTLIDVALRDSFADHNSTYLIRYEALHRYTSFHGRKLETGGYLEDLIGQFQIRRKKESEAISMLQYIPPLEKYGIEESFIADLWLADDIFSALENWIRDGLTTIRANLILNLQSGIDDGPAPDISVDEVWNNKSSPELRVDMAYFEFAPVNGLSDEDQQIINYSLAPSSKSILAPLNGVDRRRADGYYSSSWSMSDWNKSLPAKLRKIIEEETDKRFGKQADKRSVFYYAPPGSGLRTWYTRELAFAIGHRVATDRLAHPLKEEFATRLCDALDFLKEIQKELNPLCTDSLGAKTKRGDDWRKYLSRYTEYDPNDLVWFHRDAERGIQEGESSGYFLRGDFSDISFKYLASPWMTSPALECALMDAMIYDATLWFAYTTKPSRWKKWTKVIFQLGFAFIAGMAVVDSHGFGAGLFVGVGIWTMLALLHRLGSGNHSEVKAKQLLDEMIGVSQLFADPRISPKFAKQRLLETAQNGAFWPASAIASQSGITFHQRQMWMQ